MKLIIGLGNPGKKYENNRHNVGFMVVDKLARQIKNYNAKFKINKKLESEVLQVNGFLLAKPQVYMNNSGEAVGKLVHWFKAEPTDLYIIHDDLDISLGEYKIQKGKGPKLHYGLQSVERALGTTDFWRVRVGVDNRSSQDRTPGEKYVLQDFTLEERETIERVIDKIVEDLKSII